MEAHLYSRRLCVVDIRFGSPPCCKNQLYWDPTHSLQVCINSDENGEKKQETIEKYSQAKKGVHVKLLYV